MYYESLCQICSQSCPEHSINSLRRDAFSQKPINSLQITGLPPWQLHFADYYLPDFREERQAEHVWKHSNFLTEDSQSMPLYEYECLKCGQIEEALQKFSDKPLKKCRHCSGSLRKLISNSSFHLKGSGWYVTDYAKKSATASSKDKGTQTKASDANSTSGNSTSGNSAD